MTTNERWYQGDRLGGLRRFAASLTIFNLLGHTVLGFEQSWAHPVVALLTAYALEFLFALVDWWSERRPPSFLGGPRAAVDAFLSAHITGLAVSMLLYSNDRLVVTAFAAAVAMASKVVFRAPTPTGTRHFLNPSNFGITVTLLLFPWVGIAPPYQFSEHLGPITDWLLPAVIVTSGTVINARFTHRLPLVAGWVLGFAAQAVLRSVVLGTPVPSALGPMTGVAFVLFTMYMITDPATSPSNARSQIAFGAAVAATYGALVVYHVVFGFFFALTIVCVARGLGLWTSAVLAGRVAAPLPAPVQISIRAASPLVSTSLDTASRATAVAATREPGKPLAETPLAPAQRDYA
jgi:hypothetical protein